MLLLVLIVLGKNKKNGFCLCGSPQTAAALERDEPGGRGQQQAAASGGEPGRLSGKRYRKQ